MCVCVCVCVLVAHIERRSPALQAYSYHLSHQGSPELANYTSGPSFPSHTSMIHLLTMSLNWLSASGRAADMWDGQEVWIRRLEQKI